MNENLILGMVAPYVKGNAITYYDFSQLFNMLSPEEKDSVRDILNKNQIELIDRHALSDIGEKPENKNSESTEFEILYDEELFFDDYTDDDEQITKVKIGESQPEFLKIREKIRLSNKTLIKMIQEGDSQAKQDLCVKNAGLVNKWASIYMYSFGNKMGFEDLQQAGMLGLIKAAEKFDLKLGTEFSTYAVWWIKQSITREIQDNGFTIRIPVHRMEKIYKVVRLDSQFAYEKEYNKRVRLISRSSGMPLDLVEDCLTLFHQFVRTTSLDLPIGEDKENSLGEFIPHEKGMSVEDIAIQNALRERISEALQTLTVREQQVLKLRFGLDDGEERTLEEVGQIMGVTRERIRQIEAKALRKLKKSPRSKNLEDFL